MYLQSFILILTLTTLNRVSNIKSETIPTTDARKGVEKGRSIQSVLNPLGEVWQSASRMLGKSIHKFRESLHEGVKVAHLLKDDVDEGVRKLKGKNQPGTLAHNSQQESMDEQQLLREGVLGGLLKLMGVNSNQLGVVALNVLIIVAEWITSSLLGGNNENAVATSRIVKDNLLEWAVKGSNPQVEKVLEDAKSQTLPDTIIKTLEEKTGNSTACVQLLVCKMSPVIWGVQETVRKQMRQGNFSSGRSASTGWVDTFIGALPPKSNFVTFGNDCEKRFPFCKLLKFHKPVGSG